MGGLESSYSFVEAIGITFFKHPCFDVVLNNHSLSITLDGAPKHPLL
jgi:hypothetical protein